MISLALSLAFADFARSRLGLSCNVLVLDEVMQHLDVDGQAAMARVLKGLHAETTIVIAHGLASDALYGDFDAIDVVEKAGDVSTVRVARSEQQAIAARLAELEDPAWKLPLRLGRIDP